MVREGSFVEEVAEALERKRALAMTECSAQELTAGVVGTFQYSEGGALEPHPNRGAIDR